MNAEILKSKFARMGVRLTLNDFVGVDVQRRDQPLTLDVRSDADGEFFDIRVRPKADVELKVVDLRPPARHLLLQARAERTRHYFLCGHDERHWFVAAIPESAGRLTSVVGAMEALKPREVLAALARHSIKGTDRQRRKNAAYVRQGEWFFLPMPKLHVVNKEVLFNEPLSRGVGSKSHYCEMLYRTAGEIVHVCDQYPQGLLRGDYVALIRANSRAKHWNWRMMRRNPEAYAKGKIRHEDHKTIKLHVWHKILMNTEGQAEAMRHVVFLD